MIELSIIIPVYNVEKYIERCIKSIYGINSRIKDVEIIIVNDGSQDNSINIVKSLNKNIPFIIIDQENKGLAEARNTGLRHASGKYVYFLDSDDYIDLSRFISLYEKGKTEDADVIIGDFMFVIDEQKKENQYTIKTKSDIILPGESFFLKFYRKNINTMVWRNIYKRKYLVDNNLYFTSGIYHEDVNWTPFVIINAKKIYYSPIAFYFYIIRTGSIINSALSKKKFDDLVYIYKDIKLHSKRYSIKIQKELGYIYIIGALVLIGKYYNSGIINNNYIFDNIRPVINFHNKQYIIVNLIILLFSAFPDLLGILLKNKYATK